MARSPPARSSFTRACTIKSAASLRHTGTEVTNYQLNNLSNKGIDCLTLAPGGLLFFNLYDQVGGPEQDEIVALDAQTLRPRHQFGLSLLNCTCGMVVAGEELFVCDQNNDRCRSSHSLRRWR